MTSACRLILCLIALLSAGVSTASGIGQGDQEPNGIFHVSVWRFQVWGRSLSGLAGWIRDDDGRWRLELVLDDGATGHADSPAPLLDQAGEGWTAVSVDGISAYIQPWRDKLETLPESDAGLVSALLELAECGARARSAMTSRGAIVFDPVRARDRSRLPWADFRAPQESYVVEWPAEGADLRDVLESRGRGRGGHGEIWHLVLEDEAALRMTSSRRSGVLHMAYRFDWPAHYDPDEVFMPMWSLGDLVELGKNYGSGTGTPPTPVE